jgi:hypothetical protein
MSLISHRSGSEGFSFSHIAWRAASVKSLPIVRWNRLVLIVVLWSAERLQHITSYGPQRIFIAHQKAGGVTDAPELIEGEGRS